MRNLILILCLITHEANADTKLCYRYADKYDCTMYRDSGKIERRSYDMHNETISNSNYNIERPQWR